MVCIRSNPFYPFKINSFIIGVNNTIIGDNALVVILQATSSLHKLCLILLLILLPLSRGSSPIEPNTSAQINPGILFSISLSLSLFFICNSMLILFKRLCQFEHHLGPYFHTQRLLPTLAACLHVDNIQVSSGSPFVVKDSLSVSLSSTLSSNLASTIQYFPRSSPLSIISSPTLFRYF